MVEKEIFRFNERGNEIAKRYRISSSDMRRETSPTDAGRAQELIGMLEPYMLVYEHKSEIFKGKTKEGKQITVSRDEMVEAIEKNLEDGGNVSLLDLINFWRWARNQAYLVLERDTGQIEMLQAARWNKDVL